MNYNFTQIEKKWQKYWEENKTFHAEIDNSKPKFYCLDFFPYPSAEGLHVGHVEGYTASDIMARYKRMRGFNVLHPMGWDAFGLQAEQFAVKQGIHPKITVKKSVANFKRQLKTIGLSYDWDREINTTDPKYYKWTQWIFLQLYKKGLAYEAEVPVNWSPELGAILANEEVPEQLEKGYTVVRRPMKQWMLRITEYAERLLKDLELVDWPESTKEMQKNWIGKSEGAMVKFKAGGDVIEIFTTRPDTLWGATYMVLAPEHPLVDKITAEEYKAEVEAYRESIKNKSELERQQLEKEKTGVFTGGYAINPVNNEKIPVWIADYVLMGYGTGAIMAVPGHDQRDWEFAKKFNLPIVEVVKGGDITKEAYTEDGVSVNSGIITGLKTEDAKKKIIQWLEENNLGKATVQYKLRDWLFSRQRYWGEPIPVIHLKDGTVKPLKEEDLPLTLPEVDSYKTTGTGKSPLAAIPEWVNTFDEETGMEAKRETNTMPQWAGSCWYYLRFLDPDNDKELVGKENEKYWMPVDLYLGGAEHAVLHLLYARFWHKVLYDLGHVSTPEPFMKLYHQGMIIGHTFAMEVDYDDRQLKSWTRVSDRTVQLTRAVGVPNQYVDGLGNFNMSKIDEFKKQFSQFQDFSVVLSDNGRLELGVGFDKMSKSMGNVVNPDDVIKEYGADSLRLFEMFLGPVAATKPWSTQGIEGVYRFLNRVWRLFVNEEGELNPAIKDTKPDEETDRLINKAIKEVTEDMEDKDMKFNTAISELMIFINEVSKKETLPKPVMEKFLVMLSPFAPHIAEEIWNLLGHKESIAYENWSGYDPAKISSAYVTVVGQVNGKVRTSVEVEVDTEEDRLKEIIKSSEKIQKYIKGKEITKEIVVKNKLVNIVVR